MAGLESFSVGKNGKGEEAGALCQQAKATGPVDDVTLTTLQLVFQRLHFACVKNPNNVELLIALFNCYVRQQLYVKQQQTAMKLYKMVGEERFLLWAICSIMLQVSGESTTLLQLAEALLKKRVVSHGLPELEGVLVYLELLQQLQKHDAALMLLQGPMGDLFTISTDRLHLQGELLMRSHQYEQAAKVFQEILKLSSDDWAVFHMYVDAVLASPQQPSDSQTNNPFNALPEKEMEARLQQVKEFVKELQAMDVPDLRRGPYLALVEIEKRRLMWKAQVVDKQEDSPSNLSSNLAQSILTYFQRYGYMVSFASDVKEYVRLIQGRQKTWLARALHEACLLLPSTTSPVKSLRFCVAAFQVEEQLGLQEHASDTDMVARAVEIAELYLKSVELSVHLDPQESMLGEELLTMIANLLIKLYLGTQQLGYVLEAILVLEFGLSIRRFNAHYKLLLMNLYSFLSAVKPSLDWYRTVDVKYILLESMSHHMLPYLLQSVQWDNLDSLLQEILKFHDDHQREAADLTILSYRHGTYSKVLEYVRFKERLERSHQLLVVRIESVVLSLKQKANNLEEVELVLSNVSGGQKTLEWATDGHLEVLTFNEDLHTRPWWSPSPDECHLTGSPTSVREIGHWQHVISEEEHSNREIRWRKVLKRRCLLPRILQLALSVVSPAREVDQAVTVELIQLLGSYASSLGMSGDTLGDWLSEMAASTTLKEHELPAEKVEVLTIALFWTATQLPSGLLVPDSSEKAFSDALTMVMKLAELALDEALNAVTTNPELLSPGTAVPTLVRLSTEVFAWLGLCLQAWAKCLQPVGKKKKQSETLLDGKVARVVEVLRTATTSFCSQLDKCIARVTEYVNRSEEQEVDALLSLVQIGGTSAPGCVASTLEAGLSAGTATLSAPPVWQPKSLVSRIVSSQRASLIGIRDICSSRLKTIKAIKF